MFIRKGCQDLMNLRYNWSDNFRKHPSDSEDLKFGTLHQTTLKSLKAGVHKNLPGMWHCFTDFLILGKLQQLLTTATPYSSLAIGLQQSKRSTLEYSFCKLKSTKEIGYFFRYQKSPLLTILKTNHCCHLLWLSHKSDVNFSFCSCFSHKWRLLTTVLWLSTLFGKDVLTYFVSSKWNLSLPCQN